MGALKHTKFPSRVAHWEKDAKAEVKDKEKKFKSTGTKRNKGKRVIIAYYNDIF